MTAKRNPETPSGAATLAPGFANAHAGYTVIAGKPTMRRQNVMWKPLARTIAVVVMFLSEPVRAEVLEQTKTVASTTVHYKIVLPDRYDPAKAYPAILAFGGGPQDMSSVDNILSRNFRAEAEKRGYIVVAPAAPDGDLFFEDGDRIFPEFLKMIMADHKIQDGKFHVAGPSNGGIAAFHVAASNPQYFLSVTAFPGFMWQRRAAKLQAITKMCVFMYVGEFDRYRWHGEMQWEAEYLRSQGALARYTVEKDQPHGLATLAGANAGRLFDGFEETKNGCRSLLRPE
jgi:pimeloyl-ACP methyl ester carboxylesterase